METTLDQLRRLVSEPDGPDLRSWSGTRRGYRTLFAGCTPKVSMASDSRPAKRTSPNVRVLAATGRVSHVEIHHSEPPIAPHRQAAEAGRLAS